MPGRCDQALRTRAFGDGAVKGLTVLSKLRYSRQITRDDAFVVADAIVVKTTLVIRHYCHGDSLLAGLVLWF